MDTHSARVCVCVYSLSQSLSLSLRYLAVETHRTDGESKLLFRVSEIRHGHVHYGQSVRVREVEGQLGAVLTRSGLSVRHNAVCYYMLIAALS